MITVTYLLPARVAPRMFVDAENPDSVEAVLVVDQDPLALNEDGVVGGVLSTPAET